MLPKRLDNPLEYRGHMSDEINFPPKGRYPHYHSQRVWVAVVDGIPTYATWDGPVDMKLLTTKTEEHLVAIAAWKERLEKWLKLVKA